MTADGDCATSQKVRKNARRFIDLLEVSRFNMPDPEVSLKPYGTISFEWTTPHAEACLEIGSAIYNGFIRMDRGRSILLYGRADWLDLEIVALMYRAVAGRIAETA